MLAGTRADVADHARDRGGEGEPILAQQLGALLGERRALACYFGLRLLGGETAGRDLRVEAAQAFALGGQPLVQLFEVELEGKQPGPARFDLTLGAGAFFGQPYG